MVGTWERLNSAASLGEACECDQSMMNIASMPTVAIVVFTERTLPCSLMMLVTSLLRGNLRWPGLAGASLVRRLATAQRSSGEPACSPERVKVGLPELTAGRSRESSLTEYPG